MSAETSQGRETFSSVYQRHAQGQGQGPAPASAIPPHLRGELSQARALLRSNAPTQGTQKAPTQAPHGAKGYSDPAGGYGSPARFHASPAHLSNTRGMPQSKVGMPNAAPTGLAPISAPQSALSQHPWSSLFPTMPPSFRSQAPRKPRDTGTAPPVLPADRFGVSCRYTSWTGEGGTTAQERALEDLKGIMDGEDEEDEYGYYDASSMVKRLTMMPSEKGNDGLANPFSWKELEKSCRHLDEANVRIDQIDLTCVEDDDDNNQNYPKGKGNRNPKVRYNLCVDPSPPGSFQERGDGAPVDYRGSPAPSSSMLLGSFKTSSSDSSHHGSISLSHQGSTEMPMDPNYKSAVGAPQSYHCPSTPRGKEKLKESGASIVEPSPRDQWKPLGSNLPSSMRRRARIAGMMRNVKEKCGLLFTTSSRGGSRRAEQLKVV